MKISSLPNPHDPKKTLQKTIESKDTTPRKPLTLEPRSPMPSQAGRLEGEGGSTPSEAEAGRAPHFGETVLPFMV